MNIEVAPFSLHTPFATLQGAADLLSVQLHQDAVLTRIGIMELVAAIGRMPGNGSFALLLGIPAGTDVHLDVMLGNCAIDAPLRSRIRALGIVTTSPMFVQLFQLYLAYHSSTVPSATFSAWEEACYWATAERPSRGAA